MTEPESTPADTTATPEEQDSSADRVAPTVRNANGHIIIMNIEAAAASHSHRLVMATERAPTSKPRGRRLSGLTETLFETLSEHLAADNSFTCAPEEIRTPNLLIRSAKFT
jgi:hypothetical protein